VRLCNGYMDPLKTPPSSSSSTSKQNLHLPLSNTSFIFDYPFHHLLLVISRKFRPEHPHLHLLVFHLHLHYRTLDFFREFENVSIFILKLQWVDIQTEIWVGLSLWCGISFGDCVDR